MRCVGLVALPVQLDDVINGLPLRLRVAHLRRTLEGLHPAGFVLLHPEAGEEAENDLVRRCSVSPLTGGFS